MTERRHLPWILERVIMFGLPIAVLALLQCSGALPVLDRSPASIPVGFTAILVAAPAVGLVEQLGHGLVALALIGRFTWETDDATLGENVAILLAGPIALLAAAEAAVALLPATGGYDSPGQAFLWAFFVLNVFGLVILLLPFRTGSRPSPGLLLLELLGAAWARR